MIRIFIICCHTASLSGVVVGTTFGWNSPVAWLTMRQNELSDPHTIVVYMAGCFLLGTVLGGMLQGRLTSFIGYRWSAFVYDSVVLVGWLILTQVHCLSGGPREDDSCYPVIGSSWVVLTGRLVHGFGTGGLGLLTPTYICHITDFVIRGRVQMFHQAFVCFGILFAYDFGHVINYQMLIGLCIIWPFLHMFIAITYLPESPYHLFRRHSKSSTKVKKVLRQIKGKDYDVDSDYIEVQEYMEMVCDTNQCCARSFFIGLGLVVFQQTCGVNPLLFHIEEIFGELCYISTYPVKLFIICIYAIQVLQCMIAVELVEFLGRKFMLIVSALGMSLSLLALVLVNMYSPSYFDREEKINLSLGLIFLYICSYSVGWGPVVILVYTEIIHCDALQTNEINKTIWPWLFIASCVGSIAFVYCSVPETRALELNRIRILNNF
ncbi:Sugar transporter, conserved site,Major facilitator superfamily domain,Major facilitator, sugar [Cinara cedri]|uniref:Sugar transporter, conserved site,Major facilitator superfamily domain,Major facilitator, sugar n=1 Tax=Cinara cedri TaxID=506608 RepID=A0A5E4M676_9HEMI|nr:Sugar transporter, conserved site,Major facilitator superfamily domain,Major facilitator, sugar [Cinara cedri]